MVLVQFATYIFWKVVALERAVKSLWIEKRQKNS